VLRGVLGELAVLGFGLGVEVSQREHQHVGVQRLAVVEPHPVAHDLRRGRLMHCHRDVRRQRFRYLVEEPRQVPALHLTGRERRRVDVGPLRQRRAGTNRAKAVEGVVREDGDVLGHGVHAQQRGLGVPPHPAGARRVRVDDVHRQGQRGRLGGDAFQQAGGTRTATDDDE
jgi:hypothetical protein